MTEPQTDGEVTDPMDADERPGTDQRWDHHDTGDPVREGLEHLQAAGRELAAAARAAVDAFGEWVDDPDTLRGAAGGISDFFRNVARSTGLAPDPDQRADDSDPSEAASGTVERIPLDPE